jgi:AbrB family looped-hinge helix DNA binding protein
MNEVFMKIDLKGRVTIPKPIREKTGLLPNTEVEIELVRNSVCLRKVGRASPRTQKLIALMRGKGTVKMSTDEIMALTRAE